MIRIVRKVLLKESPGNICSRTETGHVVVDLVVEILAFLEEPDHHIAVTVDR